jgi:hypothetical protein
LSSSTIEVAQPEAPTPKPRKTRVGRKRRLVKRVEPKPDGRYLIYYEPS